MGEPGWWDDPQWRTSSKVLDADSLKGLAHPMRVRLLALLRNEGPSTATRLGQRLDENTGATSYHLRQLARHGFVAEDPERGTRRERWWRALHRQSTWSDLSGDAGTAAAEVVVLREQLTEEVELVRRWLEARMQWPAQWRTAAGSSDYQLRLTPEQTHALTQEINTLIEHHRGAAEEPDTDDSRSVAVFVRAVPRIEDRQP